MSEGKFDIKQAIEIFKFMNLGGVLSVVLIGAVVGFMYATGCGPVVHSTSWGDPDLLGRPAMQDHPEEAPHADPGAGHGADHAAAPHGDEAQGTEAH